MNWMDEPLVSMSNTVTPSVAGASPIRGCAEQQGELQVTGVETLFAGDAETDAAGVIHQPQMEIADGQIESGGRAAEEAGDHAKQVRQVDHDGAAAIENAGGLERLLHGGSAVPQMAGHLRLGGLHGDASDQGQRPIRNQPRRNVRGRL